MYCKSVFVSGVAVQILQVLYKFIYFQFRYFSLISCIYLLLSTNFSHLLPEIHHVKTPLPNFLCMAVKFAIIFF